MKKTAGEILAENDEPVTIIGLNTEIIGDIRTNGDITVEGTVIGNVETSQKVIVIGRINGNIKSRSISLTSGKMKGDISAWELVVDKESLLCGEVHAHHVLLDGKVKGTIKAEKQLIVRENAVFIGRLISGNIAIAEGAELFCEITD